MKRLIVLVSAAEQAGHTTLLETPKTDFLALQPINKKIDFHNCFHDRASNRSCDPDQAQLFIGPGPKRFAKVTSRRQK